VSAGVPSVAVASVAAIVTTGNTSSSTIVTVALAGDPTVYAAFALSVTITVSLPSTDVSSIVVTVIAAELCPTGITTLPVRF
jgi:hypothetical protein